MAQLYQDCGPVVSELWPSCIRIVAQLYQDCGLVVSELWPSCIRIVAQLFKSNNVFVNDTFNFQMHHTKDFAIFFFFFFFLLKNCEELMYGASAKELAHVSFCICDLAPLA